MEAIDIEDKALVANRCYVESPFPNEIALYFGGFDPNSNSSTNMAWVFKKDYQLSSIDNFTEDHKNVIIYPNPSREIFNIEFTSLSRQNLEIRIINSFGEIVYLENLENYKGDYNKAINLKDFSKALYFLEIITDDGVVNKKLILQ